MEPSKNGTNHGEMIHGLTIKPSSMINSMGPILLPINSMSIAPIDSANPGVSENQTWIIAMD